MENIQVFLLISLIILIYLMNKSEIFNVLESTNIKLIKSPSKSYIDGKCNECTVTDSRTLKDPSQLLIVNCPINCPNNESCESQNLEGTLCSK